MKIGPVDLAIVLVYMVVVTAMGLVFGGRQRSMADYTVGQRDLPWWAVLFSIVATETSTATFLSVPGIAFGGNLTYLQLSFGYIVGRYVVVFLLLPHYFRGQLFTAYEVLDRRFGGATKRTASMLFIVTRCLADGLRLFLAAIVLQEMFGLELSLAAGLLGAVTIVYTFFGGIKAVVWNDCFQFIVYISAAILALMMVLHRLPGGWEQVVEFSQSAGRHKLRVFDFSFDLSKQFTFWAGLLGGSFLAIGSHGADQLMVQRYLCARSQRDAARALALSGWVVLLQNCLFLSLGLALAAFYWEFPPATPFKRNDQVFARFIVDQLPSGVMGLTLAGVFASAMSTLSGSLNSLATSAVNDLYRPLLRREASPTHLLAVSRGLTFLFGLILIGVAIGGQFLDQSVVVNVLSIAAFTTGVVLGLFFLAIVGRRVRTASALVALVSGLVIMGAVKYYTTLAWPWFAICNSLVTLLLGLVADSVFNLLQGPKER